MGGAALAGAGFAHALFAVLMDELEAVGVVDEFGYSTANLGWIGDDLDRRTEHFGLDGGEGRGKLGAVAGKRNGGFAEADELFGGGACGGDRQIGSVQAVAVGVVN